MLGRRRRDAVADEPYPPSRERERAASLFVGEPSVPEGWEAGPPHFLGVGFPRCGSTWWYSNLTWHPEIAIRDDVPKELSAIEHEATEAQYHAATAHRPLKVSGEWTPSYALDDADRLGRLRRLAPSARVLVLVRDPVERYWSQLRRLASGKVSASLSCFAAGFYHRHLGRVFDVFGRDSVLVLQHERCVADPEGQIARTYGFLGVRDDFVPPTLRKVVNESPPSAPLHPGERAALVEAYRPDAEALARAVPELDLDLWASFR